MTDDRTTEAGRLLFFPCLEFSDHNFVDEYYGTRCARCQTFYAYGAAPWDDEAIDAI